MRSLPWQQQRSIPAADLQPDTYSDYPKNVDCATLKTARDCNLPIVIICLGPILPGDPPIPAPELMTESEAIRYLRLDTVDISDPTSTLRRYRDMNLLRATQVSKRLFYRRLELDRFLERVTEENPR